MDAIQIPTLLFWENGNSWYGSSGPLRFYIRPEVPEGMEEQQLSVQIWRGPLAMDASEILARAVFPITEEGLVQTAAWLEARAAELSP